MQFKIKHLFLTELAKKILPSFLILMLIAVLISQLTIFVCFFTFHNKYLEFVESKNALERSLKFVCCFTEQ